MLDGMDSTGEARRSLGRLPALDGLRGIAILLVIACHSAVPHMALAGQIGVTVFFVLSGFLITTQLLARERVDFRRFWLRRARRLLPALLVMLAVLFPVFLAAGWSARAYWGDAWPALVYVANFHELAHGWTLPFGHLWSLSVEEQFYLLFPFLIAVLRSRPRLVFWVAVLAGSVSAVARVWLSLDPATQMRGYFGMDTNAFALLLGAALAAATVSGWRPRRPVLPFAAGALLVGVSATLPPVGPVYAASVPAAAGAGLLIAAALTPEPPGVLSWSPLRFCGRISYGWYLWQGPLLALTWSPLVPGHMVGKATVCLIALGAAALSWRYVEAPLLQGRSVGVEADAVEVHPAVVGNVRDDVACGIDPHDAELVGIRSTVG